MTRAGLIRKILVERKTRAMWRKIHESKAFTLEAAWRAYVKPGMDDEEIAP